MPRRPNNACDIENAELATFNDRLFAHMIDLFLVHMISGITWFLIILSLGKGTGQEQIAPTEWYSDPTLSYLATSLPYMKAIAIYALVFWSISALYQVAYVAAQGATPGKEGMGIRVVSHNGQKATLIQAANRYLWQQISVAFGIHGFFLFFTRSDHRTLYDITSETIVIKG